MFNFIFSFGVFGEMGEICCFFGKNFGPPSYNLQSCMASCSSSSIPNFTFLSPLLSHTQHTVIILSFLLIIMRAIFCCFLVLMLNVFLGFVGASSRHFDPRHGFVVNNQGTVQNIKSLQITKKSNEGTKKRIELVDESGTKKEINKIGSSPPSCQHKCYGCMPCEAIQVPSNTGRVGVQYTNYEPEGWKCKCGPTFYSP